MKVLICKPRLDVTFKEGPVPRELGPIPAIREHWRNFVLKLANTHEALGDKLIQIELPLWQFTPELVTDLINQHGIERVYIPHREVSTFPLEVAGCEVRYYMQTVFPWIFYIDPKGFAGGLSNYPLDIEAGDETSQAFDKLRAYTMQGKSKFDQPESHKWFRDDKYMLFTCQIPHDQTILHHSEVGVLDALKMCIDMTRESGTPLVVKSHPVNPASMTPLKEECSKWKHVTWIDDVSIHDAIQGAFVVATVNSGTGMEALLYKKPVLTFGKCEYDVVTNWVDGEDVLELCESGYDEVATRKFFDIWTKMTYDTNSEADWKLR